MAADYLVMESTYGDRLHDVVGNPVAQLSAIIQEAHDGGGNVIIPAFAVGRTQEVVYYLERICAEGCHDMPIYVDSPLATRATEVFRRHGEVYDPETQARVKAGGDVFSFPGLRYTASVEESRSLNGKRGVIIISSSGMAEAGRIKHHLKHNLWRPEAHVVLVGYQAQGTLGRRLLEGDKRVRIFGEEIAVKAHIHEISGFSAHADREQLLAWAAHFASPCLTLLTHGEPAAALSLEKALEERFGFRVEVPEPLETIPLSLPPSSASPDPGLRVDDEEEVSVSVDPVCGASRQGPRGGCDCILSRVHVCLLLDRPPRPVPRRSRRPTPPSRAVPSNWASWGRRRAT